MPHSKTKVVVIMGPTASGKTSLAVRLAEIVDGEIISADSRQVYRGMDIGSGKDLEEYAGIKYHLIDIREAGKEFSVSDFQKEALKSLNKISSKKKVTIICGGTGHYVKALLDDYLFSDPGSNFVLTHSLERLERSELYRRLKDLGLWDQHDWLSDSKRRMARAIEKKQFGEKTPIPRIRFDEYYSARLYYTFIDRQDLRNNIEHRLTHRLKNGLIEEVENLSLQGVAFERLERYGLEYKWVGRFLKKEISHEEMTHKLLVDIGRFAKRQMTFIRYMQKSGHQMIPITDWNSFSKDALQWLQPSFRS
ncbi:MAG: tRNA (adenosine(37)-N6)-dimethylallyltransferase MiaA [Proteobacteria bacterium]|nr:tRNA (adenosine(37)-N6)-dimethylallyltransferase MiaA [Pseudomonadota bacterium]